MVFRWNELGWEGAVLRSLLAIGVGAVVDLVCILIEDKGVDCNVMALETVVPAIRRRPGGFVDWFEARAAEAHVEGLLVPYRTPSLLREPFFG